MRKIRWATKADEATTLKDTTGDQANSWQDAYEHTHKHGLDTDAKPEMSTSTHTCRRHTTTT